MRVIRLRFFLRVIAFAITGYAAAQAEAQPPACAPPQVMRESWNASFVAGCIDRNGKFAGGSQIIHLVPHKSNLYAASGYWKDKRNVWYGGTDPKGSWAQVLRLSGPSEPWTVDLEMGPQHLRPELLKSVTFTQDAEGRALPAPDTLLIAATFDGRGSGISVFVRNDETGTWVKTRLISGNTGVKGGDNSVRAATIYRDRVTGQESLFLSVGILGIYAGRYDPSLPGKIRWAAAPEAGSAAHTRILSIVDANGSLFFSEGTKIFRRIDGPTQRYVEVTDMSGDVPAGTDRATFQSIGGIRGLTAIAGPVPGKQSLIYMWHAGPRRSLGCVYRLDPQPDGSYARGREACLADHISRHLGGAPVSFVLGAYNTFMPLRDPKTNESLHLSGMEAFIPSAAAGGRWQHLTAHNQRNDKGGFYAGGLYALRDAQGRWRVGEVNGKYQLGQPELVSIYTFALSPFGRGDSQTIYLGGYDANNFPSSDTSWVFSTDLANLLGR